MTRHTSLSLGFTVLIIFTTPAAPLFADSFSKRQQRVEELQFALNRVKKQLDAVTKKKENTQKFVDKFKADYEKANANVKKLEAESKKAKDTVSEKTKSLTLITRTLQEQIDKKTDVAAALKELNEARAARNTLRDSLTKSIKQSTDYLTAAASLQKAQEKLKQLNAAKAPSTEILAQQRTVNALAAQPINIINTALNANPEFKTASQTLLAATRKVSTLRTKYKATLRKDAQWLAANKLNLAARKKLSTTQRNLAAAKRTRLAKKKSYARAFASLNQINKKLAHEQRQYKGISLDLADARRKLNN